MLHGRRIHHGTQNSLVQVLPKRYATKEIKFICAFRDHVLSRNRGGQFSQSPEKLPIEGGHAGTCSLKSIPTGWSPHGVELKRGRGA